MQTAIRLPAVGGRLARHDGDPAERRDRPAGRHLACSIVLGRCWDLHRHDPPEHATAHPRSVRPVPDAVDDDLDHRPPRAPPEAEHRRRGARRERGW